MNYCPVTHKNFKPTLPEPPVIQVSAAMMDFVTAVEESKFAVSINNSLPNILLAKWLVLSKRKGHGRLATDWAIYRHLTAGHIVIGDQDPSWIERETRVSRIVSLTNTLWENDTDRDWDLFPQERVFVVVTLPTLWEWKSAQLGADHQSKASHKSNSQQWYEAQCQWERYYELDRFHYTGPLRNLAMLDENTTEYDFVSACARACRDVGGRIDRESVQWLFDPVSSESKAVQMARRAIREGSQNGSSTAEVIREFLSTRKRLQ